MPNTLTELMTTGQSIWFDNIRRAMLKCGDLARMIEQDDLRGVTSNPTIFEKAITGSNDYDEQLRSLINLGLGVTEIYEALVIDDIVLAADILRPVFDRTKGIDGYISLEVNPRLAYDTQGTIDEATRLFTRVDRPNVMIKIPAAQEGLPAIEESIYRGVNINVTMIFSLENYVQVAEAFIKGLERRAAEGKNVDGIASVASFFVSRVDTAVDTELEYKIRHAASDDEKKKLESYLGLAANANAKLAYQKFKEIFHGPRFAALRAKGAQVQRCLWASTGTKNPKYPDVLYLENLIGPETVNTVPPATYDGFKDHGKVALTLEQGIDGCRKLFADLAAIGIDMAAVTNKLQIDGLKAFVGSFDTLVQSIESKRDALVSGIHDRLTAHLGSYGEAVVARLKDADKKGVTQKIWKKDAALWKQDDAHQKIIRNAMGWLTVVDMMIDNEDELIAFAEKVKGRGFTHVMLCGMGGSSLCPEVFRRTFGKIDGWPELVVLDTTDPEGLELLAKKIDLDHTMFVISSKSGTTTEPLVFYKYWFDQVAKRRPDPGRQFVAVTDPGTMMETMATEDKFKRVFLNPADIGGRYSALSYFGMVPAALMGLEVKTLLDRADRIVNSCASVVAAPDNPGARLGAIMGECANAGRNKLTIVADPKVASLGLWVEQLIAESTGKEGKGIVPVAGEPLGEPSVYGDDRLFVSISVGAPDAATAGKLEALEAAGHPVIYRTLNDLYDLGEEFFLWEFATAFAGHVTGINPFDQPNVQESKDATKELLDAFAKDGALKEQTVVATDGTLTVYAHAGVANGKSVRDVLKEHFASVRTGDYVALLDYIEETDEIESTLQRIRTHVRDRKRVATTTGYGPRFLHSTGQLHKGGSDEGVFVQVTAPDSVDFAIPGQSYSWSVLKSAQALGDFRSLATRGRRALRVDLGRDVPAGLKQLHDIIVDVV